MGEKIRQIAVVLGAINLDNQKRLLLGMENAAKEMNANLYVFTNYVGTRETEESVMASSQILKLLEFDKFDGLILVPKYDSQSDCAQENIRGCTESGSSCCQYRPTD